MSVMWEKNKENEYEIRALTRPLIRQIYEEAMTRDFPPDELKPLRMIEKALDEGRYACYGYFRGGEIIAYAYLAMRDRNLLVDYFAVEASLRGRGLGSLFLRDLSKGPLGDYDSVLLEVEDPDYATDPGEKKTRLSRLHFYLRNGLTDSGARALLNHVNYAILTLPVGPAVSQEEVFNIYLSIYDSMLKGPYRRFMPCPAPRLS